MAMYPRDVDDREFGPDPDEGRCVFCGAGPLADCAPGCKCAFCVLVLADSEPPEPDGEAFRGDEAAAYAAEQAADWQRLK